MIINIKNLDFAYGTDDIFKKTDFRLEKNEKIGLIGKNGSGKSTFLKLLTGELEKDSGEIIISKDISLGYLHQLNSSNDELNLREYFLTAFEPIFIKQNRLRELEKLIEQNPENDSYLKEYGDLQEFFSSGDKYDYKSRIKGMTVGLGFKLSDLEKKLNEFSGGEKTKINLGLELLKNPDLLILDEPTNFLDIKSLEWLEDFLKNYNGSVILVSHDRYFLNKICERIDEIENFSITRYKGNYDNYLLKKAEKIAQDDLHYKQELKEYKRQKEIIKRYRDINSKQSSKHARSREIQLSKLSVPVKREKENLAHFNFETKITSGEDVLKVENLSKSFNQEEIFNNINFLVKRGEKIGIIGKNGIGKTTLFNILKGLQNRSNGKYIYGSKVKPGWYDQESDDLEQFSEDNLIETIRESNIFLSDGEIRNILASFLFTNDDVFKKVKDLSGGERARIKLAKLMLSEANFLLMDEPTNHIDMPTREILEDVLLNYSGTLLFISHDRYFLNKIANKIYEFTPTGINEYLGNYDDYLKSKQNENERKALEQTKVVKSKTKLKEERKKLNQEKKKLKNYKAQLKTIEKEIDSKTEEKTVLENLMSQAGFYQNKDKEQKLKDYENIKRKIEELNSQWEELALFIEEIESEQ